MRFSKFLKTPEGRILLSIILGFGLATCFRLSCTGNKCVTIKAAPISKTKDKVYKFKDKCYSYSAQPTSCKHVSAKIIDF
jgi:hypothetical protein